MLMIPAVRLLPLLALSLTLAVLAPATALAFEFDWSAVSWTDGDTGPQVLSNVDNSGISVTVEVSGDTGFLTQGSPDLSTAPGNPSLRLRPDFDTTDQQVTATLTFSQPVAIENLVISDIDADGFSDGVRLVAGDSAGLELAANDITLGSNVVQSDPPLEFQPAAAGGLDPTDPAGWLGAGFSTQRLVQTVSVTQFPGDLSPADPGPQAIYLSNFQFFVEPPLSLTKVATVDQPVEEGSSVSYTITLTNNRDTTQTGISIVDLVSSGATYQSQTTVATGFGDGAVASDDFGSNDFSGGTGWTADWDYVDPAGVDPGSSLIQVLLGRARFQGTASGSVNPYIARTVSRDLSSATTVTLNFDIDTSGNLEGNDRYQVQASSDGGTNWTVVASYQNDLTSSETIDISGFASAATAVRLGVLQGVSAGDEYYFIDNVEVISDGGPLVLDNVPGGSNGDLADGVPPNLVTPADGFILPAGESMSVAYSAIVDSPAVGPVVNVAAASTSDYSTPRRASAVVAVSESCPGPGRYQGPVVTGPDDGWWVKDGDDKFNEDIYELGKDEGDPTTAAGVRFLGVNVPGGANITSAVITFEAESSDSGSSPGVTIAAVDSADAPVFNDGAPDTLTAATVDWDPGDWTADEAYTTPDLTALVQELVNNHAGLDDVAVAFVLLATGDVSRKAKAFEGYPADAAELVIEWDGCSGTDSNDAPAAYGIATHQVGLNPTVYLGVGDPPDTELTTLFSPDADGDDSDNVDDENAVTFRSPAGQSDSIIADVEVVTDRPVTLCAWLDRPDGSFGAFEAADGICSNVSVSGTVELQWSGLPADQAYATYARFRVSSDGLDTGDFIGAAADGEVEDYRVQFDFTPTAVTIGRVALTAAPVADFLASLGADELSADQLFELLRAWDEERAGRTDERQREVVREALVEYLDPDGDGQVAVMGWDTLEERGTVGFYVERREAGGAWERVNQAVLPGLIAAPMGGQYQLADPGARPGRIYEYRLIELEARGGTRPYGPFEMQLK